MIISLVEIRRLSFYESRFQLRIRQFDYIQINFLASTSTRSNYSPVLFSFFICFGVSQVYNFFVIFCVKRGRLRSKKSKTKETRGKKKMLINKNKARKKELVGVNYTLCFKYLRPAAPPPPSWELERISLPVGIWKIYLYTRGRRTSCREALNVN